MTTSPLVLRNVMSGLSRGPRASALRLMLRMMEPFYGGAVGCRNKLYDARILQSHRLPRPVISIGNITTGGTGKTPMVQWLAAHLRQQGRRVGILSRGYRSDPAGSDELRMLERALNSDARPPILLQANPNRFAGGMQLLRQDPQIDLFLLDDGFQHRRLHRDFDLVLIDALEPFGFGHLLPRGMLREKLSSLARASAFVLTHCDLVDNKELKHAVSIVREQNVDAPIFRSRHALSGLRSEDGQLPADALTTRGFFTFCGIGNPDAFARQFAALRDQHVGHKEFADHHHYTGDDLAELEQRARAVGADLLLTTEKDWVKIQSVARPVGALPIWRAAMQIEFKSEDGQRLISLINQTITGARSVAAS